MYVHPRLFSVASSDHLIELPSVSLVETHVICQEIERSDPEISHIFAHRFKHESGDALLSVPFIHIYGTDVRSEIRPLMEIVLYYSTAGDYGITPDDDIPLRDNVALASLFREGLRVAVA